MPVKIIQPVKIRCSASQKIIAFNRCLAEDGETMLFGLLERNEKAGIVYHENDKITGDYDLENISDILRLIREGKTS